jgi:DNA-binding transcriptional LysR family regulator
VTAPRVQDRSGLGSYALRRIGAAVTPELRLIRYWVAVAEERHVTRAAERLHMAQPPLSAAIRQLEQQLGVALLDRSARGVTLTEAGELLAERGRRLLAEADDVVAAVRAVEGEASGLLRLGLTPAARHGVAPELLAAWSERVPGVMLHTREDTTGALVRDVRDGRLDLALLFCPPPLEGLAHRVARDEPAVVHVPAGHPVAGRPGVALEDLHGETFLVAGGKDSPGFTAAVLAACRGAGFEPVTRPDPYPDLGTRAVREGLGVVLYVRSAFAPGALSDTVLVPVDPPVTLPFVLAWRGKPDVRLAAVLDAAA